MPHRCAAMTAYRAVRRGADLRYGESEAVVATGAGSNILHFARAMGSDPIIAIDVKDGSWGPGVIHTVNSVMQDARQKVFEITDSRGVEIAFEALGIPVTWMSFADGVGTWCQ